MIRVLFAAAILFVVAAAFAWLAENPGDLSLTWQGYEVRTSLMVGAIAIAIVVGLLAVIGAVVRAIVSSPQSLGHFLGARRRERGYRALTRGMVAVGAGDAVVARRSAGEAKALLGSEPLVLLLSAQAAQIGGDSTGARTAFEALSADQETRVLGLHGLFVEARRQGEHTAARHFAEEAARISPRVAWAGGALFDYQVRAGDWKSALETLATNSSNGVVDKEQARRFRAVLDTALVMEIEGGDPDQARGLAMEAHKLAPDLVPAAVISARLLVRGGDIRRATKILETTWKLAPHPDIAEAYAAVRPGDAVRDRLKRARRLADIRPGHPESAMAIARAAIDAGEWPMARAALSNLSRAEPTERVCLMMAEIDGGESNDAGRARSWLTRAVSAPPGPAWVADGQVFDRWAPVSPISGKLDAFVWREPPDRPHAARTRLDLVPQDDDEAVTQPVTGIVAPPQTERSSTPTVPGPMVLAGPPGIASPGARPRPVARAPDDPGPEPVDDDIPGNLPLFGPGRTA